MARELTALGHSVIAADYAPSLLEAARQAGSARDYVVADAGALPFGTGVGTEAAQLSRLWAMAPLPG